MAVSRIDWQAACEEGAIVTRAVLVAGLPYLLVPAGVTVSSVSWTGDTDAAWTIADPPATKGWLLCRGPETPDVPSLVIEETASPVQGTLDVRSIRLWLVDPDDEVTLALRSQDAVPFTRLVADLTASGMTVTVESTDAFPSSGVLHLGRERIEYGSKTSTTFIASARGTAGTRARAYSTAGQVHRVYGQPSGATVEALPSLKGRRITLWMLRLDGTTAVDPTLVYDGRIAADAGLSPDGAAWELPVEHAAKSLETESDPPSVTLYGYAHGTTPRNASGSIGRFFADTPVRAAWVEPGGVQSYLTLNSDAGDPDHGGWSPSREVYVERLNRAGRSASYGIRFSLWSSGILATYASDGVHDRRLTVAFGWNEQERGDPADSDATRGSATVYSVGPMPAACLWLLGPVHLDATDLALIPAVPTFPLTDSTGAWWTLAAERDNGVLEKETIVSRINTIGASTVDCSSLRAPSSRAIAPNSVLPWLIVAPTQATLGLYAQGARWWSTLRYAVLVQLDQLRGLDQVSGSIAWDRLEAIGTRAVAFPTRREYQVDIGKPALEILRNEAALSGACLSTWRGRVAMAWIREAAVTEAGAFTITRDHLRYREHASVKLATDGLATSYKLTLDSGDTITVNDAGAIGESGAGETLSATVPPGVLEDGAIQTSELRAAVTTLAQATLAPWVRPYEVVEIPGDLRLAGVEIGDVGTVSEWCVPDGQGGRGLDARAATVLSRSVDLDEGTVTLRARLSPSTIAGYAPAALVASISGAVLTIDTATVAACGFADDQLDDGSPRTDGGASTFSVGHAVVLVELDASSPTTAFQANVSAVSGTTITLDAAPGSTWETLATGGLVMLAFDAYSDATTDQHRWAYVASRSTFQQPDGTQGRRWT